MRRDATGAQGVKHGEGRVPGARTGDRSRRRGGRDGALGLVTGPSAHRSTDEAARSAGSRQAGRAMQEHIDPKVLRSFALAAAMAAIQMTSVALAPVWLVRVVFPATFLGVAPILWWHRSFWSLWVVAAGATMNFAAIVANGGLMPITVSTLEAATGEPAALHGTVGERLPHTKDVLVADGEGRLTALGDRIIVTLGSKHPVVSLGDVFIAAGLAGFAAEAGLRAWRSRRRHLGRMIQPKVVTGLDG